MLELQKRQIHMSRSKGSIVSQITLDEDFIIPDSRADVESILLKQADAVMEEVRQQQEKVHVRGRMEFELLCSAEASGKMQNLPGSLAFEDSVSYPGLEPQDYVRCRTKVEDISIRVVNSRKLHISAVLGLELSASSGYQEEAARDLHNDMEIALQGRDLEVVSLQLQKKDTFRMEEDFALPSGKPSAQSLLWRGFSLHNMEYHPEDGKLRVKTDAQVFVIYEAEQEQMPMQWAERSLQFTGELPLAGCTEEMIPSIEATLIHKDIEIRTDEDGENRILHVEAVAELDMKLYQEERIHLLCDAYSPRRELDVTYKNVHLERLLMKNQAKCKVTERVPIHPRDTMLQICHSYGKVSVDRTEIVKEGIRVEGALYVTILYLAANDEKPMQSASGVIPVSHVIEAGGIEPGSFYDICPTLEQMNTMIAAGGEAEVRAVVSFDTLVLSQTELSVLDSAQLSEESRPADIPCVIGYIVQPGDSLWSIAKKYRTTIERIRAVNQLKSDTVEAGVKLLLVKS